MQGRVRHEDDHDVSPGAFVRGNDLHIAVDRAEADRAFALLSSDGGQVHMPLANAPWGPYFGMCVDRFGVQGRRRALSR